MKKTKYYKNTIGWLVLFILTGVVISVILTAVGAAAATRASLKKNMNVTSAQTLDAAQKGFSSYIKTLGQTPDANANEVSEGIESYISDIGIMNTGFVVLVNKKGTVIVNNDNNSYVKVTVAGLSFWSSILALSEQQYNTVYSFDEKINGKNVHIVASKDADTEWTLVGFVDASEIKLSIGGIAKATMLSLLAAIAVGGGMAYAVAYITNKHYNNINDNRAELIRGVEEKSAVITDVSEEISKIGASTEKTLNQVTKAIRNAAQSASKQAAGTRMATENVESLADRLSETMAFVGDVGERSAQTHELSNQGIFVVDELADRGERSKDNSRMAKQMVDEMSDSIGKAKRISDSVTQITNKTRLLSRNASAEAARFGMHGHRFSTAANDIRKLAEESQNSTDEIVMLIEEINGKTMLVAKMMEHSVAIVDEQNSSICEVRRLFADIQSSIGALQKSMGSITKLNSQMEKSRAKAADTIDNVAGIADDTAIAIEKVTETTAEISNIMDKLHASASELDRIAENIKKLA